MSPTPFSTVPLEGGHTLSVEHDRNGLVNLTYFIYGDGSGTGSGTGIFVAMHLTRADADALIDALKAPEAAR